MCRRLAFTVDRYISIQFLAIYFLSIALVLTVVIAFDVTEKLDRLLQPDAPLRATIWDYYVNFVPYYMNLFSPLFVLIAVIYVTSRLAGNNEIIAILSCGMSFRRLLEPCMLGTAVTATLTFLLSNFVIPPGNRVKTDFQNRYTKDKCITYTNAIQMQVAPETFMLMSYYNDESKVGYTFSTDRFEGKNLKNRAMVNSVIYDTLYNQQLQDYIITYFGGRQDALFRGNQLDTTVPITPGDFFVTEGDIEIPTTPKLYHSIQQQRMRGAAIQLYVTELHKRIAMIPTSFILTLMGVPLSARRRKGGMGLTLAAGLSLSFTYILFIMVTASFAMTGAMAPVVATWLPSLAYLGISSIPYRLASRQTESSDARGWERRNSAW